MHKVVGIGNAIIDLICKVSDDFISQNKLEKSTMKLISDIELKNILRNLKIEQSIAGGSVANSIVGLSHLKNDVAFIGKINDDTFGKMYEESLILKDVNYYYEKKREEFPTGVCVVLITPDAERTMCTHLGIAGKINEKDIDEKAIKNSEITFLEGYLWDKGDPKKAFDKAISLSNKSAISLSDKFCVDRHKTNFLELVKNKLDIIFANEQEIMSLIDAKSFDDVIEFGKSLNKILVITRGEKGSLSINNGNLYECDSKKNIKVKDLTGAGDLFAAGYLHGFINKCEEKACLEKGNELASIIIQKIGARLI